MFTTGCLHPLATGLGPSPAQAPSSFGLQRWTRQDATPARLPLSTMTSRRRAQLVLQRAAIEIPPDALVHPFRETFRSDNKQWSIEKVEEAGGEPEKVKIRFPLTGVDESKIDQEVEVYLPSGSNVLTIKKTKKAAAATADNDVLDVRLLLTAGYNISMEGIKAVKEKTGDGKLFLEVTVARKTTNSPDFYNKIDIK